MTESAMTEQPAEAPTKRLRIGRIAIWVAVAALLIFVALGLMNAFAAPPEGGRNAPDFTMVLYRDQGTFSLAEQRGQVVVINFWASWCAPCKEEAPALEATWNAYKDRGVMFAGVDYVDAEANALEYLDEFGITYPNGPDLRTEISDAYHIRGVPETFIVDREGNVVFYAPRPISQDELTREIEAALAGESSGG